MMDNTHYKEIKGLETPFYYYDMDLFRSTVDEAAAQAEKYGVSVHYAVKANTEPRLLQYMAAKGFGADCVSANEVSHAIACGFAPASVVYAGVGKTDREINDVLSIGEVVFNCESLAELRVIEELAVAKGIVANVSLRINPNIDAHTHEYITTGLEDNKFGIPDHNVDAVIDLMKTSANLKFKGLHFHIGSQITDPATIFRVECEKACEIISDFEAHGLMVENIDLGGGLGVDYDEPDVNPIPEFETWFRTIADHMPRRPEQKLHVEPGRSLVAQCGSLVAKLLYVKECSTKTILILDAGMNDLIRPALYGSYHKIENWTAEAEREGGEMHEYEVVGPVCESADVWGKERMLPESRRGDIFALRSAGAYGATMQSRYNMRDLARAVFSDEL